MHDVLIGVAERLTTDVRMLPQQMLKVRGALTNDTLAVSDGIAHSKVGRCGLVAHGKDHLTLSTSLSSIIFLTPEVVSHHERV